METVINFNTFKYYLNACNGNTEDALFLVHLMHWFYIESFNDYELIIYQHKFTKFLGFTPKKVNEIHNRICPRFGIRFASYGLLGEYGSTDGDTIEELHYFYNADFALLIKTLAYYWEK
jgi:hypothetical protein